ncbi:MAG: tRNA uridine-5-carboxymethylaminomethyl(34) synthesis GTPase MnmE, partial [Betaproteobacteria bacterium]|nr:tRNA uridine-5-carboxymethylaminomethyl(34) synthesis GTPase MnmE [Betaproteobacteria bacterium]
LCREDRAIVTPLPGTTRDVLSVDIDLGGLSVRLHDTAGLRDAADPIEQEGLRRARALLKRCDALLYVTAIDQPADAEPLEVVAARQAGTAVLTVINKQDLQPAGSAPHSPAAGLVPVSALTGDGIAALEAALLDIAGGQEITDAPFIARARHVDALTRARNEAAQAAGEYRADAYELACEALRQASRALEEMTGVYTSEDLLGDIFSRFCIGK